MTIETNALSTVEIKIRRVKAASLIWFSVKTGTRVHKTSIDIKKPLSEYWTKITIPNFQLNTDFSVCVLFLHLSGLLRFPVNRITILCS